MGARGPGAPDGGPVSCSTRDVGEGLTSVRTATSRPFDFRQPEQRLANLLADLVRHFTPDVRERHRDADDRPADPDVGHLAERHDALAPELAIPDRGEEFQNLFLIELGHGGAGKRRSRALCPRGGPRV